MGEGKSMSTFVAVFDSVPSVEIVAGPSAGRGTGRALGPAVGPITLESASAAQNSKRQFLSVVGRLLDSDAKRLFLLPAILRPLKTDASAPLGTRLCRLRWPRIQGG